MLDLEAIIKVHGVGEYMHPERIMPERRLHACPTIDALMRIYSLVPQDNLFCAIASSRNYAYIGLEVKASRLAAVATEQDIIDLVRCGVGYSKMDDELAIM